MPEAEGSEGEALKILARRIIQAEGNVARTEWTMRSVAGEETGPSWHD